MFFISLTIRRNQWVIYLWCSDVYDIYTKFTVNTNCLQFAWIKIIFHSHCRWQLDVFWLADQSAVLLQSEYDKTKVKIVASAASMPPQKKKKTAAQKQSTLTGHFSSTSHSKQIFIWKVLCYSSVQVQVLFKFKTTDQMRLKKIGNITLFQ